MSKEFNKNIYGILKGIKHPAIDRTLFDLGIIKSITFSGDKVKILLAFPYPNVPVKTQIIDSIKKSISKEKLQVDIEEIVMNEKELEKFFSNEQKYWKGQ